MILLPALEPAQIENVRVEDQVGENPHLFSTRFDAACGREPCLVEVDFAKTNFDTYFMKP